MLDEGEILGSMDYRQPRSAGEIAAKTGYSPNSVRSRLQTMEKQGLVVETTGFNRNRAWTKRRQNGTQTKEEGSDDVLRTIARKAISRLSKESRIQLLEELLEEI